jgi:hypothetical protein
LVLVVATGSPALAQNPSPDQPLPAPQPAPPQPPQPPPPPHPDANWAPPPPGAQPAPKPNPPPPPPAPETAPAEQPVEQVAPPPPADEPESSQLEVYGFAMFDGGYDFGKIGDPLWQDVERPTKLPAFDNEFGKGGRTFESVRQSRFGVKGVTPTKYGEINTRFEFELFGTGVDAGQTTFRLRHAYGEWCHLTAGQTWSPFMDPDVFPNSIEYWGPNGMVFFRNVQIAYKPWTHGDSYATVALERPGASADQGSIASTIELQNVVPRFPAPDVSANFHWAQPWGHLQIAGIFRYIKWDDLAMSPVIEGHVFGWGVNVSGNVKLGPTVLKLQGVYGQAIQNYMNDAGDDVGPKPSGNPMRPFDGDALGVLGIVAFVDMEWNKHLTSTAGWSFVWVDNSQLQNPDAFHIGHYALANVLFHPSNSLFFGPEFQFGRRQNNSDGFTANDYRIQFSIQYKFSQSIGGVPR